MLQVPIALKANAIESDPFFTVKVQNVTVHDGRQRLSLTDIGVINISLINYYIKKPTFSPSQQR